MKRSILCILAVLLLCTVQAGVLPAQSLTSFGGDVALGQTPTQMDGFFSDPACDNCGSGQQAIADNFVVATGTGFLIETVTLWGGYFPGNTPNAADSFDVLLHADAAGLPGRVVDARTGVVPTRAMTGLTMFGIDEYIYTLDLVTPFDLLDGTYWIEITNDSTGNSDDFLWETGALDGSNGIAGAAVDTVVPGSTWAPLATQDFALQLSGQVGPVPVALQSFDVE